MRWRHEPLSLVIPMALLACVPKESADGSSQQPLDSTPASLELPTWRPHAGTQGLDALSGESGASDGQSVDPPLGNAFEDDFEREALGSDWLSTSRDSWQVREGRLCGQQAHNHPLWLKRRLPKNARISFTAQSVTEDGDIKVEAWGDGRSYAKGSSYHDATGYVFVFGGWANRLHVLARLNEHGGDRKALELVDAATDLAHSRVVPRRNYHFVIERRDGITVSWQVDGSEILTFEDRAPLQGQRHDHFAFNNWESAVCFDDLVITPTE